MAADLAGEPPTLRVALVATLLTAKLAWALGLFVLGVWSYFIGFRWAIPWALGAYIAGLLGLFFLVLKSPQSVGRSCVAPVGCFTSAALLAMMYLFVHLWVRSPKELYFLSDAPFVGALLTCGLLFSVPGAVHTLLLFFLGGPELAASTET